MHLLGEMPAHCEACQAAEELLPVQQAVLGQQRLDSGKSPLETWPQAKPLRVLLEWRGKGFQLHCWDCLKWLASLLRVWKASQRREMVGCLTNSWQGKSC